MWGYVPVPLGQDATLTTVITNGSSGSVRFEIKKHCSTGRFELRIYDGSFSERRPVSELEFDSDGFAAFAEVILRAK